MKGQGQEQIQISCFFRFKPKKTILNRSLVTGSQTVATKRARKGWFPVPYIFQIQGIVFAPGRTSHAQRAIVINDEPERIQRLQYAYHSSDRTIQGAMDHFS